jgi:hypothetical protein
VSLKYLLDEHVPHLLQRELRRHEPTLTVWLVGGPSSPPLSTGDPEILEWCEEQDFVLVTNNRRTMPSHLADHLSRGRHSPGIFVLNSGMALSETVEELVLIAETAIGDEHRDAIWFLPIS